MLSPKAKWPRPHSTPLPPLQGYRFLDSSNMPRGIPQQADTEAFKEAMERAQSPEFKVQRPGCGEEGGPMLSVFNY